MLIILIKIYNKMLKNSNLYLNMMIIKIKKKFNKIFINHVFNKVNQNKVIKLHQEIRIIGKRLVCLRLLMILVLVQKKIRIIDSNNNHIK